MATFALSGCDRGVLAGDAVQGAETNRLFFIFLAVVALAFILVLVFLGAALLRAGKARVSPVADGQGMQRMLLGWLAFIVTGIVGLTLASFLTDRGLAKANARSGLQISLTAKQWWWAAEYDSGVPSNTMRTANELHLPLGVPVHLMLRSQDVIHSFWVPELAGKQDIIPGRMTDITITPRRAGLFQVRCAEFCGAQHTNMKLNIQVEPLADFQRWWQQQLRPAPPPSNPLTRAGYDYVTTRECSACHAIAGTTASSNVGPDLTHLASRRSLAAGAMPMSRASLYAWIADPQSQKPGNHMPTLGLEPDELHAVVAYLETLK